jgi:hypothetical protein
MPFSEPKISGDHGNSMVRVPGRLDRVSANVLVERVAREVVYVNNHDSAIVKVAILRMIMELQFRLGPSTF